MCFLLASLADLWRFERKGKGGGPGWCDSMYLPVTSSESTPHNKMHSNLILVSSCFVATWDVFCLGGTSDNCFVSAFRALSSAGTGDFSFSYLLSLWDYLGLTRGLVRKFQVLSLDPNIYENSSKKHSGRISPSCCACLGAHNPKFKHVGCGPWTVAYFYNI